MATATLKNYLLSLMQNNQASEVELQTQNFLSYRLYLEGRHYDFIEYQSGSSQLLYCLSGKCEVKVGTQTFSLVTGNILLIEKDSTYAIKLSDKNTVIIKFKLSSDFSWEEQIENENIAIDTPTEEKLRTLFLKNLSQDKAFLFTTTSVMWSSQSIREIVQGDLNHAAFNSTIGLELLKVVILRNLREQNFKLSERRENSFKDETLDQYIDQHYNDISLAEAAEYFGFNRNYFSTMVKEKTGKSFVEHVDDRRMREARRLLARPNVSLKEIIETIGYSSKSFFYKKFKHYYGMTPAEMRKRLFREAHINLK
ncbi:AraC family transcriptional regulator [Lactobacillus johnsonii]|uniref:AraC family transcriptional regulator n=1 Tax=Lactobacillus johnsonii TaxID=33959 RepID=UPI0028F0747C|nr:AraC family transcriptional regulator [Lactobacillus johnsonii]MDT9606661.1 AraC family transcriptional regulator [Lactobacillus johnsonii]